MNDDVIRGILMERKRRRKIMHDGLYVIKALLLLGAYAAFGVLVAIAITMY